MAKVSARSRLRLLTANADGKTGWRLGLAEEGKSGGRSTFSCFRPPTPLCISPRISASLHHSISLLQSWNSSKFPRLLLPGKSQIACAESDASSCMNRDYWKHRSVSSSIDWVGKAGW